MPTSPPSWKGWCHLHRRREMLTVLARANESIKAGNVRGLVDAIDELHRADKPVQAALATQIQSLEQGLKLLTQRQPTASDGAGLQARTS